MKGNNYFFTMIEIDGIFIIISKLLEFKNGLLSFF